MSLPGRNPELVNGKIQPVQTISGADHLRCRPSQVQTISGADHLRCRYQSLLEKWEGISPFYSFRLIKKAHLGDDTGKNDNIPQLY
jgi:hypothetical protein